VKKRLLAAVIAAILLFSGITSMDAFAAAPVLSLDQKMSPLEINKYLEEQLPKTPEEWAPYICESFCIDYKSDTIQAIATQIKAQNFSTQKEQLYAVYTYPDKHLTYKNTPADVSATQALKNGYGDCEQFAYVSVAIANALGIPCVIVFARTNIDPDSVHFFQDGCTISEARTMGASHCFVIAYADNEIVRFDPTWGYGMLLSKYFDISLEQLSETHIYIRAAMPGRTLPPPRVGQAFSISSAKLEVDGHPVPEFKAIIFDGTHYMPLRDTALVIGRYAANREKQFSVFYDPYPSDFVRRLNVGAPGIALHAQYAPSGGEFSYDKLLGGTGIAGQIALSVNGVLKPVDSILIDGTNYIKLRDIFTICDIHVEWIQSTQTISLDTSKPY